MNISLHQQSTHTHTTHAHAPLLILVVVLAFRFGVVGEEVLSDCIFVFGKLADSLSRDQSRIRTSYICVDTRIKYYIETQCHPKVLEDAEVLSETALVIDWLFQIFVPMQNSETLFVDSTCVKIKPPAETRVLCKRTCTSYTNNNTNLHN